ncbi:DNA recombination-dependent growth factor [gamma proteobacterium HdN1]|nr:DNA recombination-dependent growth factor [gamma proteobacterium HdN1]
MWFRNLLMYRFTQTIDLSPDTIEAALASKAARACGSQELATYGFFPPLGKSADGPLVHASNGFLLLAARREERILPSSVVRDGVQEKIEEIEIAQARKVYKKEREQIKDEVIQSLLPRAFLRRTPTYAAIAPALGLVIVDSASFAKAEDFLSTLREALGSLPVRPISVQIAPSATLTEWVKTQQAAADFTILDECELRDAKEEGSVVRCKRQDLASEEIGRHLDAGKQVTQLSLNWQDKISFVLDEKLSIKRLRFEDLLQEQALNDGGDDYLSQQDASFTLMMLTLTEFLPRLLDVLGGEELPGQTLANSDSAAADTGPAAEKSSSSAKVEKQPAAAEAEA